jgi:hypothetical protein
MKSSLLVLSCLLGFSRVQAGDFFGESTGPKIPPMPTPIPSSAPATPAPQTPKPAPAATPVKSLPSNPIVPVRPATPAPMLSPSMLAPSSLLGSKGAAPSRFLQPLGPLQSSVKAWFAFNDRMNGGLAWSAEPLVATLSEPAVLRESNGGRVADFAAEGAVLSFPTPVVLGQHYTLAAWVSFPLHNKNGAGMIFRGIRNDLLNVQASGKFACFVKAKVQTIPFGDTPAPTSGWHHVALSVAGVRSTVYVDGRAVGSVPFLIEEGLSGVGNHVDKDYQGKMMTSEMDDVAIFNRGLTDAEIAKVMLLRFPVVAPVR